MLCREHSLVNYGDGYAIALPLRCRSWGCDYCQPERRREVVRLGMSGRPNRFVTLTIRPDQYRTRANRAAELAGAWRIVAKRIRRQFLLPPEQRWPLKRRTRTPVEAASLLRRLILDDSRLDPTLDYLAVFEAHRSGEPHLHLLLRSRYIDQAWLSEQMLELVASPVVDIRKVKSKKGAAGYVSKYMGKAPGKFGTCKRYWKSGNWEESANDNDEDDPWAGKHWYIVERSVSEIVRQWIEDGKTIDYEGEFDVAWWGSVPRRRASPVGPAPPPHQQSAARAAVV